MSELKDYSILDIEAIDDERFKTESAPGKWVPESRVYLKSEADKVIADLKDKLQKESALLKETRDCLIESQKMHKRCADNAIKAIRHQKYRRCLDKAKWCDERIARYSLQQEIQGISWQKEIVFYRRLKNKFIEISRQFEEAQ